MPFHHQCFLFFLECITCQKWVCNPLSVWHCHSAERSLERVYFLDSSTNIKNFRDTYNSRHSEPCSSNTCCVEKQLRSIITTNNSGRKCMVQKTKEMYGNMCPLKNTHAQKNPSPWLQLLVKSTKASLQYKYAISLFAIIWALFVCSEKKKNWSIKKKK